MLAACRVLAVVAVTGACVAAWRANAATDEARVSREAAVSFADRLVQIERLRPKPQTALLSSKPTESVSASVRATLSAAGVPEASLRSLNPGSDEAVAGETGTNGDEPAYRRQSVAITVSPIASPQLGRFLSAWHSAEPAWVVTRIELTHAGSEAETAFEARLTLTTTYLASSPPRPK